MTASPRLYDETLLRRAFDARNARETRATIRSAPSSPTTREKSSWSRAADLRARAATARAMPSGCWRRARRDHHSLAFLAKCTLYTAAEPCAMCAGAIYWAGIGRIVYGLSGKGLKAQIGAREENPSLDLPCRIVFSAGQRPTEVVGPLLEDEAAALQADFWKARDAHHLCIASPLIRQAPLAI